MAKPILLTVDDDTDVLRAIERDLRSHFALNTESSGVMPRRKPSIFLSS